MGYLALSCASSALMRLSWAIVYSVSSSIFCKRLTWISPMSTPLALTSSSEGMSGSFLFLV